MTHGVEDKEVEKEDALSRVKSKKNKSRILNNLFGTTLSESDVVLLSKKPIEYQIESIYASFYLSTQPMTIVSSFRRAGYVIKNDGTKKWVEFDVSKATQICKFLKIEIDETSDKKGPRTSFRIETFN